MSNAKKVQSDRAVAIKHKIKRVLVNLMPLFALAVLFAIYLGLLISNGYVIEINLKVLLNETIILAFVATGAIFIFTLGSFDISLGASTLFSATLGILAYKATGSVFVLFLVCIGVAVGCSLLNSGIASVFKIPMFVTTVAMLSVLSALASNIIKMKGAPSGSLFSISIPYANQGALVAMDNPVIKLVILAVFIIACVLVFNFLKVGRNQKFLGGNAVCGKMTGIIYNKYAIIAFVMAGIGVGLGASMTVIYSPSVSASTAGSIGMSVFIAIVFGGMPISGGPRSRIYAALVGGLSYIVLRNILQMLFESMSGARDGLVQIISAIFFLVVVYVASINYRSKNLPR